MQAKRPTHRTDADDVRTTLGALAAEADFGAIDAYGELLAPDCTITSPAGTTSGRDAIVAQLQQRRAAGIIGPGSGAAHLVSVNTISIDGDVAEGRSTFVFLGTGDDGTRIHMLGEYRDQLRRRAGGWVLGRREVRPA